jgi:hypothetical protein
MRWHARQMPVQQPPEWWSSQPHEDSQQSPQPQPQLGSHPQSGSQPHSSPHPQPQEGSQQLFGPVQAHIDGALPQSQL